jgi:hypothetical protein
MRHGNRRRERNGTRARANEKQADATGAAHYDSLADFYRADARRVRSRERDVGLWWRDDVGGPLHRAAWVLETGELYLVRLGPGEEGGGEVELLATVAERERLDRALRGWRERCGERRSLAWLRARAEQLGAARGASRERAREASPADHATARASARRERASASAGRVGAGAGTTLAAVSSLASELVYRSRPRARATPRSSRLSSGRLTPGISLPTK